MANKMEAMKAKAQAAADNKAKAGEAMKAKQSAMADKMKSAAKDFMAKKPVDSAKPAGGMKAGLDKLIANRPASAPARPAGGTSGGMGGGMGARPAPKGDSFEKVKAAYANENNRINASKAAGTYKQPEVRGMMGNGPPSRPMGGMGMKKGGKAKAKKK
jgi:hypothetical protein